MYVHGQHLIKTLHLINIFSSQQISFQNEGIKRENHNKSDICSGKCHTVLFMGALMTVITTQAILH
jgi:hypothetical protein